MNNVSGAMVPSFAERTLRSFEQTFVNADLVAGVLTVTHNLGVTIASVVVVNNLGVQVVPDSVTFVDANTIDIDLSSFGAIVGTWALLILA